MEHRDADQSQAAALTAIVGGLGCSPDSLRVWVRKAQRDGGERPGQTTAETTRIKELEREVRELRQADEVLRKASAHFAMAALDCQIRKLLLSLKKIEEYAGSGRCVKFYKSPLPPVKTGGRSCVILTGLPPGAKSDAALSGKIDAAPDARRKLSGARTIWSILRQQSEDAARLCNPDHTR